MLIFGFTEELFNINIKKQCTQLYKNQAFYISSGRPHSQALLLADWRNSNLAPIS